MGIKQRREREKQEVRQSILSAAREIAKEEGWQAVTTRKVADRIEYSQPTIYEYFENKDAILLALLRNGYERLIAALQVAFTSTDDPEKRLLVMSEAYWDFAFTCPELYQVMHGMAGLPAGWQSEAPEEVKNSFSLILEAVRLWAESKGIESSRYGDLMEARRGSLHGLIVLTMAGRVHGGQDHAKHIMLETMKDLLFAWSHRPPG